MRDALLGQKEETALPCRLLLLLLLLLLLHLHLHELLSSPAVSPPTGAVYGNSPRRTRSCFVSNEMAAFFSLLFFFRLKARAATTCARSKRSRAWLTR